MIFADSGWAHAVGVASLFAAAASTFVLAAGRFRRAGRRVKCATRVRIQCGRHGGRARTLFPDRAWTLHRSPSPDSADDGTVKDSRGSADTFHRGERSMAIKRHGVGPRLSQAVVHGDTVYLAGIVAEDPSADIKGQTEQVLRKIDGILKGVGSDKSKLLSAQIFITDMRNFADMNSVWDGWGDKQNPPARATVQASLANPKMLVEIMVQAAI